MDMVTRCIPSSSSSSASSADVCGNARYPKELTAYYTTTLPIWGTQENQLIDFEHTKCDVFEKRKNSLFQGDVRPESAQTHADDAARTARPTHALRKSVEKNLIPPIDVAHTAHRRSRASRTVR